jgi:predicted DsbA family dithiol-disulfide isomerase
MALALGTLDPACGKDHFWAMKLDIFSDPVCPWCYLGKANLDRALEAHAAHPFEVEWHPFQLNPEMPEAGVDKREYLSRRFGAEQLEGIHQRFRDIAAKAGVQMDPDTPKRIPNTLNAHRLIHWAGLEGRQTPMVSALMRGYWVQGRDIGDPGVLADLAEEAGLDRAAIARLLASDADRAEILQRETHARQRGVNAVPTFVVAGQYVLSGAQPPELWGQVIDELAAAGPAD